MPNLFDLLRADALRRRQRGYFSWGGGGRGRRDPLAPLAPILTWTSAPSDTTPEFNIDFGPEVVETDNVTVQWSTNVNFTSPSEASNSLDAAEILAQEIDMAISALGAGTYYVRANIAHGAHVSNWSNVVTVNIVPLTKSYTYRGSGSNTVGGSVATFSIDIGTASADRLVIVGSTVDNATTITSVVVNGVTLTADITAVNSYRVGIHSGVVAAGDGAQNVVITWASASFQEKSAFVWTAIGLASNVKKQTANGTTSATINVTVDDFLFGVSRGVGSLPDFATSTEAPDGTRQVASVNRSADWAVNATNATFSVNAGANSNQMVAASYA